MTDKRLLFGVKSSKIIHKTLKSNMATHTLSGNKNLQEIGD